MKEEIVIRIESLKKELDNLGEQLYKVLDDKNKKLKVKLEKMNTQLKEHAQNSQKFINNTNSLLTKEEHNIEKLEQNMYDCQDRLKELQIVDSDFYKIFNIIKFKPYEFKLEPSIIGDLYDSDYPTNQNNNNNPNNIEPQFQTSQIFDMDDLKSSDAVDSFVLQQHEHIQQHHQQQLKQSNYNSQNHQQASPSPQESPQKLMPNEIKIVDMSKKAEWPCGIFGISDKELIMTDNVNNEILILNADFQTAKHVKSIGDISFSSPFGICSDEKDTIYLCDGGNHRVIVVNKTFNRVKKIIGKKGKLNGEFNFPLGVCYYSGYLYVTDHDNRRVQTFTQNGDFIKEIRLLKNPSKKNLFVKEQDLINSPWCLCVVENTIAVLDFCENIYIYNFEGQLRYIIQDNSINSICMIDGLLYTHGSNGSFSCYEKSKKKYEQHQYELVYRHTFDNLKAYSAFMTHFNDNLVITFGEKKFLAVISRATKTKL